MAERPTIPKADPSAATLFRTLLPNDPKVTVRPMFGHTAAFVNGQMFPADEGVRATAISDVERSSGGKTMDRAGI